MEGQNASWAPWRTRTREHRTGQATEQGLLPPPISTGDQSAWGRGPSGPSRSWRLWKPGLPSPGLLKTPARRASEGQEAQAAKDLEALWRETKQVLKPDSQQNSSQRGLGELQRINTFRWKNMQRYIFLSSSNTSQQVVSSTFPRASEDMRSFASAYNAQT